MLFKVFMCNIFRICLLVCSEGILFPFSAVDCNVLLTVDFVTKLRQEDLYLWMFQLMCMYVCARARGVTYGVWSTCRPTVLYFTCIRHVSTYPIHGYLLWVILQIYYRSMCLNMEAITGNKQQIFHPRKIKSNNFSLSARPPSHVESSRIKLSIWLSNV